MKNFKELIAVDGLVLVDFYANWCGPCRTMQPILEEYKRMVGDGVRILKLDVDSPANAALAREYKISSVPTLLFFRDGEIKWRGSGVMSAAQLKELSGKL